MQNDQKLSHDVPTVIMKSGSGLGGFVPILRNYGAASNDMDDVTSVAALVAEYFASDHFGPPGKQQNSFVLVSGKNRTKSCAWVAKVFLFSWLGQLTYKEEN